MPECTIRNITFKYEFFFISELFWLYTQIWTDLWDFIDSFLEEWK